ncbi:MAG: hypothetical protein SH857_17070 [Chitinophagales bacterium]|nr:hypothetical protein [Chitinophagales bacterium]
MRIETTNKEVIVRLPLSANTEDLQDFVNYLRYIELTSKFKVPQKTVDRLADEVNAGWWKKNRKRFIK